jgi:hypothetical protein
MVFMLFTIALIKQIRIVKLEILGLACKFIMYLASEFITVNINGKANPNLLAFAYVDSLYEGKNPTEFEFEENDIIYD